MKSKLLLSILIFSLLTVLFLPLYTILSLHPSFHDLLITFSETDAVKLAQHLAREFIEMKGGVNKGSLPSNFMQEVSEIERDLRIEKIKLFSADGETIYSTDPRDLGEINKNTYFFEIVAKGNPYGKAVQKNARSLDGQTMTVDVVETYIPLMKNGQFIGAFEIYENITEKKAKLQELITRSQYLVSLVALLFLVALVASANKARKTMVEREQLEREFTKRMNMEKELQESEEKYRSLVESSDDSIYLVDRNYRYLFMNRRHLSRMGLSHDQYVGKSFADFHHPEETRNFIENAHQVFESGNSIYQEYKSKKDGRFFLLTMSPVKSKEGRTIAVTVTLKDITERKNMEEGLHALLLTDQLTGLYNRRGFFTLAEQQLKIVNRTGNTVAILFADLDGLKEINDVHGHHEGDAALIETAAVLKETFRESDIIARIGGDEFVLFPVEVRNSNIMTVKDRLRSTLDAHNSEQGRKYFLSISIGVAYYDPQNPLTLDRLLHDADQKMYEHKRRRNINNSERLFE